MSPPPAPFWPCRWDWCRASFATRDELVAHVVHHTSTAPPLTKAGLKQLARLDVDHPFSVSEGMYLYSPASAALTARTRRVLAGEHATAFTGPGVLVAAATADAAVRRPIFAACRRS